MASFSTCLSHPPTRTRFHRPAAHRCPCVFKPVTSTHRHLEARYPQTELGIPMAGFLEVLSARSCFAVSSLHIPPSTQPTWG